MRLGVFSLFHPAELAIEAIPGDALSLEVGGERIRVEGLPAAVLLEGRSLAVRVGDRTLRSETVRLAESRAFVLAIPWKIRRNFHGGLELRVKGDEIEAVVTLSRRTYLASVLAAEGYFDWPLEAWRAQAVVSRSFLLARPGRHEYFDVCDTTHCQFATEAPATDSPIWAALDSTAEQTLHAEGRLLEALFTRRCAGATRSLTDVGLTPDNYGFPAVECKACSSRPVRWRRVWAAAQLSPILKTPHNETARLEVNRKLGWDAVPSNAYQVVRDGEAIGLEGLGEGHGVGYCQRGGADLAREGWSFQAILAHYFPGANVR